VTAPAPAGDEAIGLDVGGTKIAAYRIDAAGAVLAHALVPTPAHDPDATFEAMAGTVGEVRSERVRAVGIGIAGLVDVAAGVMVYGPNLPFRDLPLRERITALTGLPCVVENDANAAAWAEFRTGAGRASRDMLLVTVGTGIGGGIVLGDRLYRGAHGFGAEIGHVIMDPEGPPCGCGNRGCWEQLASGHAIDRLGRAAAAANPASALVGLAGGQAAAVTGVMVVEAAKAGDPVAVAVLAEVGFHLGRGIAGMVNVLDPDLVVVGGGAISAGDLLLEPARAACRETVEGAAYRPDVPIAPAMLGNTAGGIGAALLALEEPVPA
jgi:glucokinase